MPAQPSPSECSRKQKKEVCLSLQILVRKGRWLSRIADERTIKVFDNDCGCRILHVRRRGRVPTMELIRDSLFKDGFIVGAMEVN